MSSAGCPDPSSFCTFELRFDSSLPTSRRGSKIGEEGEAEGEEEEDVDDDEEASKRGLLLLLLDDGGIPPNLCNSEAIEGSPGDVLDAAVAVDVDDWDDAFLLPLLLAVAAVPAAAATGVEDWNRREEGRTCFWSV